MVSYRKFHFLLMIKKLREKIGVIAALENYYKAVIVTTLFGLNHTIFCTYRI